MHIKFYELSSFIVCWNFVFFVKQAKIFANIIFNQTINDCVCGLCSRQSTTNERMIDSAFMVMNAWTPLWFDADATRGGPEQTSPESRRLYHHLSLPTCLFVCLSVCLTHCLFEHRQFLMLCLTQSELWSFCELTIYKIQLSEVVWTFSVVITAVYDQIVLSHQWRLEGHLAKVVQMFQCK